MMIPNPMPWLGGLKQRLQCCQNSTQNNGQNSTQNKSGSFGSEHSGRQAIEPLRTTAPLWVAAPLWTATIFCTATAVMMGPAWVGGSGAVIASEPEHISAPNDPPGLCYLSQRDTAGRWVNDGTGVLVPVQTLCETAIEHHAAMEITISPEETAFWQAFVTAASPDALEYANAAGIDDVIEYGQVICPVLTELQSMDELRSLQAEGGLPADFDAAINVAAIHTYCPSQVRWIGR